jgi:hypothetical protein
MCLRQSYDRILFFCSFSIMNIETQTPAEIRAVLELHIGKNYADVSKDDQVNILTKKRNRYWIMIAANLFALLFFSYSFIAGITEINEFVYYILGVVFVLNLLLILYQRKQIQSTLQYLNQ